MIDRRFVKIFAVITMLIDHITVALNRLGNLYYDSMLIFRGIGRIAFPLFAYQYVDSVRKTSNHKRMFVRMLLLSAISEIPFNLLSTNQISSPGLNIMWLFTTYSALILIKGWVKGVVDLKKDIEINIYILDFLMFIVFVLISHFLDFDYGYFGALLITTIDISYGDKLKQALLIGLLLIFYYMSEPLFLLFSSIAVLTILLYNNNKPIKFNGVESLFYRMFYPLHLIIIWLVFKLLYSL